MKRGWLSGTLLAVALAANCRPAVRSAGTGSGELRITVYDKAHLPREVLSAALDRLRLILQHARIASHPVLGNLADPEASLFMYVALPSYAEEPPMACGARRGIALKIVDASPGSLQEGVLGMSSPFAAFGLNVLLFNDHIRQAAVLHGLSQTMVLSYAMAHEIGHVLLMSGFHGPAGLMSSIWTKHEYQQMAAGTLAFSDEEARTMSANLRAPVCHNWRSAGRPRAGRKSLE